MVDASGKLKPFGAPPSPHSSPSKPLGTDRSGSSIGQGSHSSIADNTRKGWKAQAKDQKKDEDMKNP